MSDGLGLFNGKDKPNKKVGWDFYQKACDYNNSIKLNDTVKVNENFYIGKQWEGVDSNGLPTPQFNILKRLIGFVVATITTDNVKVNATALANVPNEDELTDPVRIVNEEFEAIIERNDIPALIREYARNSAIDGDGCLYTYWDDTAANGQKVKGAIKTEVIENTRVFFGNPNDRTVETQPWIIIARRTMVRLAKKRSKANGCADWEYITSDSESNAVDQAKVVDDKVTDLLLLWRNEEDGYIWGYEFTQSGEIRKPYSLNIKRYPISWLPWDYVADSYHGQAMITGLIPNQIFINKAWAMSMLSIMKTAFPKVIYDKTKIRNWDNRVGGSIGVHGDVSAVAQIMDPAAISPQISQFIQLAAQMSEEGLGATGAALGEGRADNTSAIIALQRAASTPTELTKQALYRSIEDLFRIYLEFMANFYGKRIVDVEPTESVSQALGFAGMSVPAAVPAEFDFSILKDHEITIKLEAGASSYYSEIAAMQTLDNLLMNGHINAIQYLERVPDGYVPGRRKLIAELKAATVPPEMAAMPPDASGGAALMAQQQIEMPTTGGYSELQRAINAGATEGII
jgi:hypothetical protein